jgi:hypothetical protein
MTVGVRIRDIENEKARRHAARRLIGEYHEEQLRLLLDHRYALAIVGGSGDHPQLVFTDPNDVAGLQLPPAARLSFSVHPHWLGREECLDLGTTVDHTCNLEQLAKADHLTSNRHVAHDRKATARSVRPLRSIEAARNPSSAMGLPVGSGTATSKQNDLRRNR